MALSFAQAQREPEYQPSVGQEGKDVVWVPTSQAMVDKMLDMAKLTPKDFHMDLGSGDGRTVITAAKRGATSVGIEYNPDMVELSKRNAAKEGVGDKASFRKADLFETDFSKADVLTLFLLPNINVRLRPKILAMKPGTRVVSNSFDMGDWTPDERVTVTEGCTNYCNALFWIVPANVQGKWKLPNGELTLEQKYQNLSGTAKIDNNPRQISGKMTGDRIAFTVGNTSYTGQVNGNTMEGTAKSASGETKWSATRAD
ncbi:MAG: class I SAM-dependent methyltransferase [Parvibaculaceae bacterium]